MRTTSRCAGLAQAVHEQSLLTPDSPAVSDGELSLTHAEVDASAAAVAAGLRARGIGPGDAVAVGLARSWQLVCVMLGVLRLGARVVPADRLSPADRLRHILDDSGARLLVHDGTFPSGPAARTTTPQGAPQPAGPMPGAPLPVEALPVDALLDAPVSTSDGPAPVAPDPVAPAPVSFVFYTSGTTGRPKGVEVRDAGIMRLADPGFLPESPRARYACLSNPAFDALSFEVWAPLLTGGCCVVLGDEDVQSPERLAAALRRERVHTAFVTTALFNAVVDTEPGCFAGLTELLIGGEQLNVPLVRRWLSHPANTGSRTRLHNIYGPTECTTFALHHPIPRDFDAPVVPLGRPLPETGVMLLTPGTDRPAAPGEEAELLLSGTGLAAGYRNLPDETARRFVTLTGDDGTATRYYRTGDLVRGSSGGDITYVGRADRQVKVRGFRIEPGEVEQHIAEHPDVRQVYVCARRDRRGGPAELHAYLVAEPGLSWAEFEEHLAAGLPAYMRPHHLYRVPALPLTANGKVDEAALRASGGTPWRPDPVSGPSSTAPTVPDEPLRVVLDLAGEILGASGLRPGDRWIACGGDSLKALRLRHEIRRRLRCEVAAHRVLHGDLADVADAVRDALRDEAPALPEVVAAGEMSGPATGEQERLWFLQQRSPDSRAYDVRLAFAVTGPVHQESLRSALAVLVERHPALRTGFEATAEGLRQRVGDPYDPWTDPVTVHSEGSGDDLTPVSPTNPDGASGDQASTHNPQDAFFSVPFDLSRPRMLRACWLPARDGGTLLLHLHHVAVDGWSVNVLLRDLSTAYAEAAAGAASDTDGTGTPTPVDFADWQRRRHANPAYAVQRDELTALYATDAEATETRPLPLPRPGRHAAGRLLSDTLDATDRATLDRLGGELGLTRFELLAGVYVWALYGVTGQARPRVAAPVAHRPVREFTDSVGMFANTVLLPLSVDPRSTVRDEVARAAAVREVMARQDVALADVLAARSHGAADGSPFDFLLVLENTDYDSLALPGCTARPLWPVPAEAKCPVTLTVVDRPQGLECLWEYADDRIDADQAAALARLFRQGLAALSETPDTTPAELVAPYRGSLPEPGRGAPAEPLWSTVAEGFAHQVACTPTAPALRTATATVTYAALDGYAAALAAELAATLRLPDADEQCHVALFLEPSVEHVVALLALARLNLTAVPLDPSYPPALLRQVLDQTEPLCVLLPPPGDGTDFDAVGAGDVPRLHVTLSGTSSGAGVERPDAPPLPAGRGARPLYTLFTSGSTGRPKGVRVFDRTLCNLLHWQAGPGGLGTPTLTQQFAMLSFDVSFQEIFGTLCTGGCLRLIDPALRRDVPALLDRLDSEGVERLYLPYVALQLLAEHGVHLGRFPSRLREVVTAGEQLVCSGAVRRWFAGMPGARLFNHYGPTETHVVSALCLDGDPADWPDRPAIGHPVAGAVLRVVDEADLPLPPGSTGELLIGGIPVEPCYLGETSLNRERFVRLPGGGLFYRSGDLARFDHDGLLHCLGRADDQIKLSGQRLELGQVEAALLGHDAVLGAVVAVDGTSLVACLQCRGDAPAPAELREHLAGLLPGHVRVERFRQLEQLPRTPSGKLDRDAALRAPGRDLVGATGCAPAPSPPSPPSAREAQLAAVFEEVTGAPIAPDQTFFAAGASSLGLMRFHLRCTAGLGLRFTVADLFEYVTPRDLAAFLARAERACTGRARTEPVTEVGGAGAPAPAAAAVASDEDGVAVIGMAVRAPGAPALAAFWDLVVSGRSGIEYFDAPDGLVGARSQLDGMLAFDPARFGISRQEARLMDPQQRQLLMTCVEALAHAGIADPGASRTGLIAGAGENTYYRAMLRGTGTGTGTGTSTGTSSGSGTDADGGALPDDFQLALHHEKDFLATKAAFHLGLTGPALTSQTACSSSLVAVHLAASLLRQGDADVMLAGGVLVDVELTDGYRYRPQHIFSADGHCRPFSDDAGGTVGGSGAGVLVLKRLSLARRDGDTVYAVLSGSAVNNDGTAKLSYSAPSLAGQREVIRGALARSGRTGADVAYVEAHGTGTRLGDPVEAGALRQALGVTEPDRCALSSVKSQIGHLGAAAGAVGLIRAVLAVHHGRIPPTLGFRALNPEIGPDPAPFYVPTQALPWPTDRDRVAAVSSFGIGGTNAHVIVEAPGSFGTPEAPFSGSESPHQGTGNATVPLVVLSGVSEAQFAADAVRIADYLTQHPGSYAQTLRHLQAGRPQGPLRAAAVCEDVAAAIDWLRTAAVSAPQRKAVPESASHAVPEPALQTRGHAATDLAAAWLAGRTLAWPDGPAQPPWDFPAPAFDLADYDVPRASTRPAPPRSADAQAEREPSVVAMPDRLPETEWLHQPQWTRLRRAPSGAASPCARTLVVVADGPADGAVPAALAAGHRRMVWVRAAEHYERRGHDRFEADPADAGQLGRVMRALAEEEGGDEGCMEVDWLHTLALGIDGPVGDKSLDRAAWACLDTPAATVRALQDAPRELVVRPWWLSCGARPVVGPVTRPEAALLAGVTEVAPQEGAPDGHWVDIEDPDTWAPQLSALLVTSGSAPPPPRHLALRGGYWWEQVMMPVRTTGIAEPEVEGREAEEPAVEEPEIEEPASGDPAIASARAGTAPTAVGAHPIRVAATVTATATAAAPAPTGGDHLVLGGTGGLGIAIASWLLHHAQGRVLLLSRQPRLPEELTPWADRIELVEADLAGTPPKEVAARIAARTTGLASVVHAAGVPAGGLLARREAGTARTAHAAKLRGALLVELLVEQFQPEFAVYCSSMSALHGGVGQYDYAAANALLDAFAQHGGDGAGRTARIGIGWDVWREAGMALRAPRSDSRHQAHLGVGLTVAEGQRTFARALELGLPHLLVSTTDLDRSRAFYAGPVPGAPCRDATPSDGPAEDPAELLTAWVRAALDVDDLAPDASLYDLGADSLTLLDLIEKIDEHFGVELDLASFGHRASLADIVELLAEQRGDTDEITLEVWQEGTGTASSSGSGSDVVCLVHPVGGDIQSYRPLVAALDPRLTVVLIADPGLRQEEPDGWTLSERARRYVSALRARFPQPEWRWHLAGWSFGAWVVADMAAEAEATGHPAGSLHLVDPPPPGSGPGFEEYDDTQLSTVFAAELGVAGHAEAAEATGVTGHAQAAEATGVAGLGGVTNGTPAGQRARAYADRLARCCRANLRSMAAHQVPRLDTTATHLWQAERPFSGLPALGDPAEQRARWRSHLPATSKWSVLATDHYGVVKSPYAETVAEAINAAINAAGDPATAAPPDRS
ncbi:amino acid adenylation domain-containing protein [Streptomyces sp. NPDC005865]|uniref:amino acid adenylation domain-containing protein n=1 Tax=Streptomyces sp. NPDC005865 TaxID=3155453 RepID=UPI0033ED73EF